MTRIICMALVAAGLGVAQEIHVLPAQGNVYMLAGPGGNTMTMQAGADGVFLVDTMSAPLADKIVAAIRTVSKGPIRYIVDTSVRCRSCRRQRAAAKGGQHDHGRKCLRRISRTRPKVRRSSRIKEPMLNRMSAPSGTKSPAPSAAWPTDTYLTDEKGVYFNNEGVEGHPPRQRELLDGNSIVFFRKSDVISAGEIFTTTTYPVIDVAVGGNIQGVLAGLQKIVDLIIPVYGQEGGTMVIPGHGRLCDLGDVIEYREMLTIVRDRVQDMVNKGLTLEQVKAAKPTLDYDPLYGHDPAWTTEQFVDAVYKSLKNQGRK